MAGAPARCLDDVRRAKARLRSLGDESSLTAELLASRAAYTAASLLLQRALMRPARKETAPESAAARGPLHAIGTLAAPVLLPAIMNALAAFVAERPPRARTGSPTTSGDSGPAKRALK